MKKVLYSIFTDGIPNQFTGGPNNVIYKIIENNVRPDYEFGYLSRDAFLENISMDTLRDLSSKLSLKTKATNYLFKNSLVYRKIFTNDLYIPIHLKKKEIYFKNLRNKICKYDIVHSQDSISLPLIITNNTKRKKIMSIHSNGPLSSEITSGIKNQMLKDKIKKKLQYWEKLALQNADTITFPSYSAKKIFFNDLGIMEEKKNIKIIYNGINYDTINNVKVDENILAKYDIENKYDILLVNISTFREERQLNKLFSIIKLLKYKYKKAPFLINIGNGPKCKPLVNLVKKNSIERNTKLLGKIPNEDVIKLLKISDLFIMTTKRVIFDISLLEALACGACCVVSNDGGNKEIIKDGVNGYLIDVNDIEGTVKKILSLNTNIVKENAIKTAKQFTVQKMIDEYFNVYKELLNGV